VQQRFNECNCLARFRGELAQGDAEVESTCKNFNFEIGCPLTNVSQIMKWNSDTGENGGEFGLKVLAGT
jgi:hypothetical protein